MAIKEIASDELHVSVMDLRVCAFFALPAAAGFDISPDRCTVIYSRVDSLESGIMPVENFH
jgi:hypothetical protein